MDSREAMRGRAHLGFRGVVLCLARCSRTLWLWQRTDSSHLSVLHSNLGHGISVIAENASSRSWLRPQPRPPAPVPRARHNSRAAIVAEHAQLGTHTGGAGRPRIGHSLRRGGRRAKGDTGGPRNHAGRHRHVHAVLRALHAHLPAQQRPGAEQPRGAAEIRCAGVHGGAAWTRAARRRRGCGGCQAGSRACTHTPPITCVLGPPTAAAQPLIVEAKVYSKKEKTQKRHRSIRNKVGAASSRLCAARHLLLCGGAPHAARRHAGTRDCGAAAPRLARHAP